MKFTELVRQGQINLVEAGIQNADNDAWILMETICHVSKVDYFTKMREEVPKEYEEEYFKAIAKRTTRYPLQYIIGEWEFMGLRFKVNENVLIPRQDTEVLVEYAIRNIVEESAKKGVKLDVLDMCTGTGCIGITIAKNCPDVFVTGVDISEEAVDIAIENAMINNVSNIKFIRSNLFQKLGDDINRVYRQYDIIVSNPPYIKSSEIDKLMPEVKNHEPRLALDGSEDGLEFYRRISIQSLHHLKPDGCILFEIGYDQAKPVLELMVRDGYRDLKTIKDLTGKDRVIVAHKW